MAPAKPPIRDTNIPLLEISNLAAPDIPRKKSVASAKIEIIKRIMIVTMPILSKPVIREYMITLIRIMTVPGIPKIVEKIPTNNTRMKMVSPTVSRGVTLFIPL
jgi:hypothetical protein